MGKENNKINVEDVKASVLAFTQLYPKVSLSQLAVLNGYNRNYISCVGHGCNDFVTEYVAKCIFDLLDEGMANPEKYVRKPFKWSEEKKGKRKMNHVEINLKNGGCLVFPKDKLYLADFITNGKNMEKIHKYLACSVIDEDAYWDITETEYKRLKHVLGGK